MQGRQQCGLGSFLIDGAAPDDRVEGTAATVAVAASAMWMKDQMPVPAPRIGSWRLRRSSIWLPSGSRAIEVPGPENQP